MDMKILRNYVPFNEQEEKDKEQMLEAFSLLGEAIFQRHPLAHFTASALVINKERTKVLLQYHKIYQAWVWSGGHNDGDRDFLKVAIQETLEECGVEVTPVSEYPLSLDTLWVGNHYKNGEYISPHLHFNLSYLLECDEAQVLRINEDEISGLKWIPISAIKEEVEDKIYPCFVKMLERIGIKHD